MKPLYLCFAFLTFVFMIDTHAQVTPFEKSKGKETTTYYQAISFYQEIAKQYPKQAKLLSYGSTDFGKPLNVLVLSKEGVFNPAEIKKQHKAILLINNGIHPGEPEGVDASMMLSRDLLKNNKLPQHTVICIIPLYNIDGSFNRTGTSRANQNGPVAYGFRGNSRNLDLNRDFIKTDSKNAYTFQQIFNTWDPDIFVDTHTSNGADYQYTMTLIPTQKDKLNPVLSSYLTQTMLPYLYKNMKDKGFELIPYVNSIRQTPESGITGFLETPRYSTGYAALHNVIAFMPETHMLKSYDKRVESTYKLLETYISIVDRDAHTIIENKRKANELTASQAEFPLEWQLDNSQFNEIEFKGFEGKQKPSEVSGYDRLYYDRNDPYTKTIKEYNTFKPSIKINKPYAYIIPKAWDKVIDLLKTNGVKLQQLTKDSRIKVDMYYIDDMKTASKPFEGHYLHNDVKLSKLKQEIDFYEGDYVVFTDQPKNRYIMETLEPQATDSFFNWNFFDSILGQKEHFSAYIFEDTAAELLKNDASLRKKLEDEKAKNPEFAKSGSAQLNFIYKNSAYYEPTFMRYPIGRLEERTNLNLK